MEFRAQIEAVLAARLTPTHLDWHALRIGARPDIVDLMVGLAKGVLKGVLSDLDYQEYGGVPLLGINGVSIIGHGGSTAKAIKNMILKTEEIVKKNINLKIREALS